MKRKGKGREKPLADTLRFLRNAIVSPRKVGAIAPSSSSLARAIAAQIDLKRPGPILELGAGSGPVTRAIIERGVDPARLVLVEFDPDFARLLARDFPRANVIRDDAFDLDRVLSGKNLQPFAAVISSLPLLNYPRPKGTALIAAALRRAEPGAPFIQFSYGLHRPAAPPPGMNAAIAAFVWKNLPPARVWVYRKNNKA
jgi:phosphatidylethanolamine/phosphatidyl-N-methylethanolamine N-methyltransferase